MDLQDLRDYLGTLSRQSDTDAEIFGAKVPVTVLHEWGLPILVVMQLYVWLHMQTFVSRRRERAEALPFPWIGVYSSSLARWAAVISLLLPTAAVVVMCIEAWTGRKSPIIWENRRVDACSFRHTGNRDHPCVVEVEF